MPTNARAAQRRRRLIVAGLAAVLGLVLLLLGLTVATGTVAGVEVALAVLLLVASYVLQHLARRSSLYED
jgi:hypothetical protein